MDLLALAAWILYSAAVLAHNSERHAGIVEVVKENIVANDMIHALKAIFGNARFFSYTDIKKSYDDEEVNSLHITDLKIIDVQFNFNSSNTLELDDGNVTLRYNDSKTPVVKYVFSFNWKAIALTFRLNYGNGRIEMGVKELEASYDPVSKKSAVKTEFTVSVASISGINSENPYVRDWVEKSTKDETRNELKGKVRENEDLLHKHMHSNLAYLHKGLEEDYAIEYKGNIFKVDKVGQYFYYYYKVNIEMGGQSLCSIAGKMVNLSSSSDVVYYLSAAYIPSAASVYGSLGLLDHKVDMRRLGLEGTISDLVVAMPELTLLYDKREPLEMYCRCSERNIEGLPSQRMLFPIECRFAVRHDVTILSAKLSLNLKYRPTNTSHLFGAMYSDPVPQNCVGVPSSPKIVVFLMTLFAGFEVGEMIPRLKELPMVRYEPMLGLKLSKTEAADDKLALHFSLK